MTLTTPTHGLRCPDCRTTVEEGEPCGERPEGMLGEDEVTTLTCLDCGWIWPLG